MERLLTFSEVLTRAGFLSAGTPEKGMITPGTELGLDPSTGRYAFLFDRSRFPLAIEGVFRAGSAPVVIFVDATGGPLNEEAAVGWHRMAWNVGLAPLLWLHLPDHVLLLNSYRRPSGRLSDVVIAKFPTSDSEGVSKLATLCGRLAFDSGAFWSSKFARRIDRQQRVDATLLRELTAVEQNLLHAGLPALLAQKLIGRTIFSQYLMDRGLLKEQRLIEISGFPRLSDTLRSVDAASKLFEWLRATFNGDLFPPDVENEQKFVANSHLKMLADFLDGHVAETGQLSAFPFRFDFIPVELVSSIYEQFAHLVAGGSAAAQGLHYTPVNLVDLALDQVMDDVPGSARVLDPACGSGVFLVEAMRRLVWRRTRTEANSRELVRDVLRNQIFGIDINAGALQVAAFSLYLAALELDPEIQGEDLGWLRFDNLIGRNLINSSFFRTSQLDGERFDVIVGNPPWTYAGASSGNEDGRPVRERTVQPRRSPDWSFLWRARELTSPTGRMALLMKATPFFSKERAATKARRLLFSSFRNVKLINLSQLRNEGLFPSFVSGANRKKKHNAGPALLFCGTAGVSGPNDVIAAANVPWDQHFRRTGVLGLSIDDFHQTSVTAVSGDPVLMKAAVFANDREYEVMEQIQKSQSLTRLGEWCAAHGIGMEQGLQVGGGGHNNSSGLLGKPFLEATTYRPLQIPSRRLRPFALSLVHRPRDRNIYRAPLVVCPEAGFTRALDRGRYSAAVLEYDAVYTDSFVGVSFVGKNPQLAEALALVLNSKTAAFLLTFGGSNTGLKQPKIEKVDLEALAIPDLMRVPLRQLHKLSSLFEELRRRPSAPALEAADEAVMDLYGLRSSDRRIIQDVLVRTRPIFLDSREERQTEVASLTPSQLHEYGEEVSHWMDTALRQYSSARTVITRGIRVAPDVVALRLDIEDGPPRPLGQFAIAEPDLFESSLFDNTTRSQFANARSGRSMRLYLDRSIFIVKPNELRHWATSNAQSDFRFILDDLTSGRAEAPLIKMQNRDLRHVGSLTLH